MRCGHATARCNAPLAVAAAIGKRRPFLATRNAVGVLLRGTDRRSDVSVAAGVPSCAVIACGRPVDRIAIAE